MMNQSAECVYRMFASRGYLPLFKNGDVFVFMSASALLSVQYHSVSPSSSIKGLLGLLLGEKCSHPNGLTCCKLAIYRSFKVLIFTWILKGCINALKLRNQQKIFGLKSLQFGLFCGSFVGLWKGTSCFLRNKGFFKSNTNSILTGIVAGLSMIFYRSTEISMYCFSKGLESLIVSKMKKHSFKPLPHSDILLFVLCSGIIFYNCTLEPYNLRPSYWRFMRNLSGGRFDQFETIAKIYNTKGFLKSGFKYPKGIKSKY